MYNVKFFPEGDDDVVRLLAKDHWDKYPYPKVHFGRTLYANTCTEALRGYPLFACYDTVDDEQVLVGLVSVTDYTLDLHRSGCGVNILASFNATDNPPVISRLVRSVARWARNRGCHWLSIPRRTGTDSTEITYRSL